MDLVPTNRTSESISKGVVDFFATISSDSSSEVKIAGLGVLGIVLVTFMAFSADSKSVQTS